MGEHTLDDKYPPLWLSVRNISDMIDASYPEGLDPEAHLWRRLMKVTEEAGEVTEALLGALGENPRKGKTHTFNDVENELFDVALAALGAVAHMQPMAEQELINRFTTRAGWVCNRLRDATGGGAT